MILIFSLFQLDKQVFNYRDIAWLVFGGYCHSALPLESGHPGRYTWIPVHLKQTSVICNNLDNELLWGWFTLVVNWWVRVLIGVTQIVTLGLSFSVVCNCLTRVSLCEDKHLGTTDQGVQPTYRESVTWQDTNILGSRYWLITVNAALLKC